MGQTSDRYPFGSDLLIPLDGQTVNRCYSDVAFGVEFLAPNGLTTIRIEGNFLLRTGEELISLDPLKREALGVVLTLVGKAVQRAVARHGGELHVSFVDGTLLRVPRVEEYEPWTLNGPEGILIVSISGGGLAIWDPESQLTLIRPEEPFPGET